jgi:hypothetical protein
MPRKRNKKGGSFAKGDLVSFKDPVTGQVTVNLDPSVRWHRDMGRQIEIQNRNGDNQRYRGQQKFLADLQRPTTTPNHDLAFMMRQSASELIADLDLWVDSGSPRLHETLFAFFATSTEDRAELYLRSALCRLVLSARLPELVSRTIVLGDAGHTSRKQQQHVESVLLYALQQRELRRSISPCM